MQIKTTAAAIAALLATTISAQTPVTESAERVVRLTNTPTAQGFQQMATSIRVIAQIPNLTIDSAHNSFVLHGTPGDLAMAEWMIHVMDKPAGWRPSDQEIWNPATREYRAADERNPIARIYYLTSTKSPVDVQEIITLIRTVADIQKIFCYSPTGIVAVRGPADLVELGEWLIRKLDLPASPQATAAVPQESGANLYRLAAPQRNGSEDLVRVFYLRPGVSVNGVQEMMGAMRKDAHIQKVFCHTAQPAIAVRGNSAQLAQAQRIIEEAEAPAAR
jgi:hypothetical protein